MSNTTSAARNADEIRVPGSSRIYNRKKLLAVLLVPLFMSLMQVSSINTALASIQISMGASDSQIQWIISGYALVIGIILVPSGRLGDIFGRSGAFVTGVFIFSLASLLIGFSQDATTMNLLRVFQGLGAGMISPQATGLIQQYFEGKARAKAFSLFGLVIAASVAAGPVMSGGLIALLGADIGWRFSFWLNFPLGMTAVILGFFWLPFGKERRTIGKNASEVEKEYEAQERAAGKKVTTPINLRSGDSARTGEKLDLDPIGMLLLGIAVLAIMVPFMLEGNALVHLISLGGFALLAAWVIWEKSYKARGHFPMVDLNLFRIKTFKYGMSITAIQFLGMTSVWTVFAIFLQNALGATAFEVGMISLPNAAVSAVASVLSGRYALEHGRFIQVLALSLYTIGVSGCLGITYLIDISDISFWWVIIPTILMGVGGGAMGAANQTVTMSEVPAKAGGTAGGVLQTSQRMTTAIGIAIITAIFYAVRGPVSPEDPASANWFGGIYAAFSVIIAIILVAIIIAVIFWQQGRKQARAAISEG